MIPVAILGHCTRTHKKKTTTTLQPPHLLPSLPTGPQPPTLSYQGFHGGPTHRGHLRDKSHIRPTASGTLDGGAGLGAVKQGR